MYNRGDVTIEYVAFVIGADTITDMLNLCDYYGIKVRSREEIDGNIHEIERGYNGSRHL